MIALAILNTFKLVTLTPIYLMGFSVAALLFSLNDLVEFKSVENSDPFAYRKTKLIILFIAIIAFMIIPFLSVEWSKQTIENINTFTILCSIGVVFFVIGLKQEKVANENLEELVRELSNQIALEVLKEEAPKIAREELEKENLKERVNEVINELNRSNELNKIKDSN